jgi:spermidine/putrescine transport system permease protein
MKSVEKLLRDARKKTVFDKPRSYIVGIPIIFWLLVVIITPVILMLIMSFRQKVGYEISNILTLSNYLMILERPAYLKILLRSFRIALFASSLAIFIGYPLAYYVSMRVKKGRDLFFMLIITPLWISYLVRIIAWRTILGNKGLINTSLMALGLVKEPLRFLLYNQFAVIITLTYIAIPFVFIPLYTALEKIPKNLIDAAKDLGANEFKTFINVILPLSAPGLVTGFMLAFIISLGDYIIPMQLGGTEGMMFGNIIWSQFGFAFNWPLGSALGFILFSIAAVILATSQKFGSREVIL